MDKSKKNEKMLQIPVPLHWFDDLKEQADKNKRSLPNQIKIILEPHIKLKKAK
tara:strand:+ start:115 stop:273 length:159 start_codon:yes stop_codon:yes gene_type:complete